MLEYTRIEPPKEVRAAGDKVLRGTEHDFLLVAVRGTDDVLRTVKVSIVLVPSIKRNIFSILATTQKGVKTIIEKSGSSLKLGLFSVQWTRVDSMDYFDLKIEK